MVQLTSAFLLSFSALVMHAQGAPLLNKRIAQVIADSTSLWENACLAAGGAEQCNPLSVTAFTTLLAAAGPCDQQDSADAMIDLAKTLDNDADMIKLTQVFVQQPRNTPNSQAVPYCQKDPKNSELNGLFQCQYKGADQQTFVGGVALGSAGTIPFGLSAPLSPLGSCPANPTGPIADGSQLTSITQDPGLQNIPSSSGSASNSGSSASPVASSTKAATTSAEAATSTAAAASSTEAAATTTSAAASATSSASSSSSSSDFQLQNALDAQKLNAQFVTLSADSTCNEGDQACIDGGFAMCVGGKFINMGCAATTQCFALPLVNKPGTSLACTTQDDAAARIAAPGATGGITGSD
ncbi:hypothetical protein DICSQDRAFT_137422 [Dichomitus squalens LYAD-421 SS1]|uniref:Carbohydrate-binding module family 19 domain-containing protein n=1 Tax=Dichomitus squalens (strain LYAD-421) TaxID=732165 RepID=R7SWZ9_DICSQ|nr:uncharacterized protein DICSQDRAFT_137422 [Dichomitus squalens LYAD-421 SS1]EJF60616.1 hypothetical protein DICSQDRAFT_137422 [Dichomitus squalens LYAD-421 SS1]